MMNFAKLWTTRLARPRSLKLVKLRAARLIFAKLWTTWLARLMSTKLAKL